MKVALIHDYLSQDGGAERVLKAMHEIWPEAPIFVLFHDEKKINYFNNENIHQSFLSKFPFVKTIYQWYLPLMPLATESYRLENFDIIISDTSAFAKGVIVPPTALHISYCHTPPRYVWSDTHDYIADLKQNYFIKSLLPSVIHRLRLWDKMSADRVDHFIANSSTVRRRINKYYRRDSEIIFPPADTHKFYISKNIGDYYITGGRLVPYKRLDLAIQAFNRLKWPLKIFGDGPELKRLQKMAKPNIQFLGIISDEEKASLLSRARAFIHPQIEDFGITPIESMSSGRPVIAFPMGGATETIIPKETGEFFYEQSWNSLLDTLLRFDHEAWDSQKIRDRALQFDSRGFKEKMKKYVLDRYEEFKRGLEQDMLIR